MAYRPNKIMIKATFAAVLVFMALMVSGCGAGKTAQEVSQLRKGGDPKAARELAIKSLSEDSDQMDVWRELAVTDLDLCHNAKRYDIDPIPMLMEACIISLSVFEHENGKPGSKWETAARMAASEGGPQVNYLLNHLPIHSRENRVTRTMEIDPFDTDDGPTFGIARSTETTTEKTADVPAAARMLREATIIIEFIRRLPQDNREQEIIIQMFDTKVSQLPAQVSNLSNAFVEDLRKAAVADMQQTVEQAAGDLKENGYLSIQSVLQNKLIESP